VLPVTDTVAVAASLKNAGRTHPLDPVTGTDVTVIPLALGETAGWTAAPAVIAQPSTPRMMVRAPTAVRARRGLVVDRRGSVGVDILRLASAFGCGLPTFRDSAVRGIGRPSE
jgi:hypothetical protein